VRAPTSNNVDGPNDPDAPTTPEGPRTPTDPVACDPGNKTLHRLNRDEYDRTVKDLLGVPSTSANTFPADDIARGFDNNADVLSFSLLLTEKLAESAAEIASTLFQRASVAVTQVVEAETLTGTAGTVSGSVWNLFSTGELTASFSVTAAGTYRVVVRADQQAGGPAAAQMRVSVDGAVVQTFDVPALDDYAVVVPLTAGAHTVTARFMNDFYNPNAGEDRNLLVDRFQLIGPLEENEAGTGQGLIPCGEGTVGVTTCAEQTLSPLLRRAFRRPIEAAELATYVALVEGVVADGDPFEDGVALAIEAMLLSPSFLFKVEVDGDAQGVHRLADHELATRISFFIWGMGPDDRLLDLADDGLLSRRDVLQGEVNRMLADARANAGLAHALSHQWLDTRSLALATPNPERYPLSASLKAAMVEETQLVVEAVVRADRNATDLLDANFTFVNAELAAHYGLAFPEGDALAAADPDGDGFAQVSLEGTSRSGVLTHGALLAGHSYPFRTSPVKRGRFVIDALLCIPPGDIPADVPPLDEEATGSVRERMEQHRSDPSCAACHAMMDPIGFGLESFDPAGKSRTHDEGGYEIDDDDVFFDVPFTNPAGLAAVMKQQETLSYCLVERVGGYSLGRGLQYAVEGDACTINDVVGRATAAGFSWNDVVHALVTADAFQMRRPRTAEDDEHLITSED